MGHWPVTDGEIGAPLMTLILIIITLWVLASLMAVALCMASRRIDDEVSLDDRLHSPLRRDLVA
jgi:hypothetical protein